MAGLDAGPLAPTNPGSTAPRWGWSAGPGGSPCPPLREPTGVPIRPALAEAAAAVARDEPVRNHRPTPASSPHLLSPQARSAVEGKGTLMPVPRCQPVPAPPRCRPRPSQSHASSDPGGSPQRSPRAGQRWSRGSGLRAGLWLGLVAWGLGWRAAPGPAQTTPAPAAATRLAVEEHADRLEVTLGNQPVGTYMFRDPRMLRPHWANLFGPGGHRLTRNFPPLEGTDATDHADMHSGIWLAFGDLSGHDFWRNKARIEHREFIEAPRIESGRLQFGTRSELLSAQGDPVGELLSQHELAPSPHGWLLSWQATLRATVGELRLGDQEEMGFGARVASDLTEKQHGRLRNSAGQTSAKTTWGQPAAWCDYADTRPPGRGVLLIASPGNFRESWWHNRDYGVFVANPFGRASLKQGPPSVVTIPRDKSLTVLFGAVLHDGPDFDPARAAAHWIKQTARLAPDAR